MLAVLALTAFAALMAGGVTTASGKEKSRKASAPAAEKDPAGKLKNQPAESSAPDAGSRIEWQMFGDAPFRRAQTQNRPVLLVITAPWNRQSARFVEVVMRRPDVVKVVRDNYVPILVDADLRPDLVVRYPSPSWPSVSVLSPVGDPLYLQPEREGVDGKRIRLVDVAEKDVARYLVESAAYYRVIAASGTDGEKFLRASLAREMRHEPSKGKLQEDSVARIAELLRNNADAINGGFGRAPKFLSPDAIEASLVLAKRLEEPELLEIAEKTLLEAWKLADPIDGGMHRAALREDWSGVQYEKLLDRNASSLMLYLDAARYTGKQDYFQKADEVARFILEDLSLDDGGFAYGRAADPGSDDGGEWYRAGPAQRKKMTAPPRLETMLAGPTALAARALMQYGSIARKEGMLLRGLKALRVLEGRLYTKGRGVSHAWNGQKIEGLPLLLEDQIEFMAVNLEVFELTGRTEYVNRANDLAVFLRDNLLSKETGLLMDRIPQIGGPTPLQNRIYPFAENCRAARLLARLHYMRKDLGWAEIARGILDGLRDRVESRGPGAGAYALAASEYFYGPVWILTIGDTVNNRNLRGLMDQAYGLDYAFRLRLVLDPATDGGLIRAMGLVFVDPPALYLSHGGTTTIGIQHPHEVAILHKSIQKIMRGERGVEDSDGDGTDDSQAPLAITSDS